MAKISLAQMARLFRRLATGYAAGVDLKTLYARETESGTPAYRSRSREIWRQIGEGNSLADAMSSADSFFPELAVATVRAGEKGGRLEESFDRLASHYESLVKFRNSFLVSIAWPVFELTLALLVIGVLILVLGMLAGEDAANWFGMGSPWANFLFYVACIGRCRGWHGRCRLPKMPG
jgi:type II secretory pathway component PulF